MEILSTRGRGSTRVQNWMIWVRLIIFHENFIFKTFSSRLHLRSEVRGLRGDGPGRQGDWAVQAVLQGQCPSPEQDQSQLRREEYRLQEEMSSWLWIFFYFDNFAITMKWRSNYSMFVFLWKPFKCFNGDEAVFNKWWKKWPNLVFFFTVVENLI